MTGGTPRAQDLGREAARLIGQQVGPYRILSPLGQGGMGTVFLAEHELIGRKAAIKMLNAEIANDYEAVSRFFLEARTVNQIRHPNIVDITDLGHHENQPYIVMEYLEGETLSDRLSRVGALESETAILLARQVASALGAVHEHGLVHRDLKPANIFLCAHPDYPDFVKVLDFGIAKLTHAEKDVGHQTRAGALLGTPQYMSPEQCLGESDIDARSDVYALGVVLYVALTGKLPFANRPLGQLIVAHVTETPRAPEEVNPAVWPSLAAIVMKALAKSRTDRYAGMRPLREALDELLVLMQPPGTGAPRRMMTGDSTGPILLAAAAFAQEGHTQKLREQLLADDLRAARAVGQATPSRAAPASAASEPDSTLTLVGAGPVAGSAVAVSPAPASAPASASQAAPGQPDPETVIARVVEFVDERLSSDKLPFPALTRATARCFELMRLPGFSFADLSDALMKEPHLAQRVVAQANRATGVAAARTAGIGPAIRNMGAAGLLRALVEVAAYPVYVPSTGRGVDVYRRPWHHAIACGVLAERLLEDNRLRRLATLSGSLYVAALLSSIGRPVLAAFLLGSERRLAQRYVLPRIPRDLLLQATDRAYPRVSAAVVRAWGLPDEVESVVAGEVPGPARTEEGAARPRAAVVIRLAQALANTSGFFLREEDQAPARAQIPGCCAELGLDAAALPRMTNELEGRIMRLARVS